MELLLLVLSAVFFLAGVFCVLYARKGFLAYTEQIMDCLEAMIAGEKDIVFQENQETLMGKIQMRMRRLYEIIEMKSEENLRQRKQLESMISDISHQVKTPIAGIRMYHNLLERKGISEEKREDFLKASEHQVDKPEFFMQSMIQMSRMETGLVKVQPKNNSVYELLAQAVCDAALLAEKKEMEIQVSCEENLTAYFDKRWTGEAVFNVLDNGIKYTKKGGKIWISAEKTDFFVRIKIRDNGRGIPQNRLPDIFKRFYREPESAEVEGVGIGLYLAREIVMMQKGFMEAHSRVGEGTTICIHLPIEG